MIMTGWDDVTSCVAAGEFCDGHAHIMSGCGRTKRGVDGRCPCRDVLGVVNSVYLSLMQVHRCKYTMGESTNSEE
jgi:hypothetical protein